MFCLFMTGVQSTLFGPVKYAILPQVLHPEELTGGNGLVEMGTSISILLGMIVGMLLLMIPGYGPQAAAIAMIGLAITGHLVSRAIPAAPAIAPNLKINPNLFAESLHVLQLGRARTMWCAARCSGCPGSGSWAPCSARSCRTTPSCTWAAASR